jgi:hypothetical protein
VKTDNKKKKKKKKNLCHELQLARALEERDAKHTAALAALREEHATALAKVAADKAARADAESSDLSRLRAQMAVVVAALEKARRKRDKFVEKCARAEAEQTAAHKSAEEAGTRAREATAEAEKLRTKKFRVALIRFWFFFCVFISIYK